MAEGERTGTWAADRRRPRMKSSWWSNSINLVVRLLDGF